MTETKAQPFLDATDGFGNSVTYYTPSSFHGNAMGYGNWLRENTYASREGFRSSSVPYKWIGEISTEKAYELYLESLKSKV